MSYVKKSLKSCKNIFEIIEWHKLNKIINTHSLTMGMDTMTEWMRINYEKDFNVKLQDVTYVIIPDECTENIYNHYKKRNRVVQSDLMSMCYKKINKG